MALRSLLRRLSVADRLIDFSGHPQAVQEHRELARHGNVTPDDMYHGRQREIFTHREKTKRLTLQRRKKENLRNAA